MTDVDICWWLLKVLTLLQKLLAALLQLLLYVDIVDVVLWSNRLQDSVPSRNYFWLKPLLTGVDLCWWLLTVLTLIQKQTHESVKLLHPCCSCCFLLTLLMWFSEPKDSGVVSIHGNIAGKSLCWQVMTFVDDCWWCWCCYKNKAVFLWSCHTSVVVVALCQHCWCGFRSQ